METADRLGLDHDECYQEHEPLGTEWNGGRKSLQCIKKAAHERLFYIGEIRRAKPGLDVINAYVPTDDNGLLRETHQRTERGDALRAEVSVMIPEALAFAFEALRPENDNSRKKSCISRWEGPNVRFCHYNDLAKVSAV